MSAVSFIDTSGVQMLQDLKKELLEYSRKQRVLFSNHSAADDGKRLAEGVTKDKAELTPRKTLSDIDDFELHFASVKPDVLRVLELTGLSKVILDYKAELRLSETASIEQLTPLGYSTPENDAKNANAFFTDPQNGDAGTSDMYTTNRPLKIEASELVESMFLNYPIGRPAHTRHLSEYELVSDNVHDSVDSAIAYIKFNNV
ncbi:hypothetical protein AX774_g3358 [Zancudomyces culisetae]|uniref:STAS domain-containing protein n=1 Tax=Zancudomyces culisetae TaxID=1213189 RepID=A0A1R1PQL7_ZANCU|nr:hypothetical protein AX774_g5562 [Zancudomyces culisetae]OMH83162.1 hypothetical protein AX774_g3358 [Zancudomyces culisetae]|eukprot:OMH81002.1 hypothetical protein AX774_g5562 [Zancudomyces culisetae]